METSVSVGLGWLLVIDSGDRGEDGDIIGDSGDYDCYSRFWSTR